MKEHCYITIKTFSYPAEAFLIKSRLEAEGIECLLKDELTIQVDPLLSNAIGGVKLQVKESDVEDAMKVLLELGISADDPNERMPLYNGLETLTSKITILKTLKFEYRLIIMLVIIALIAGIASIFIKI